GDLLLADQLMIDVWDGVLPDQLLRWNQCAKIPRTRAHVAMRQFEPGPGEGVSELLWVLLKALRNRCIDWIHPQSEVRREHHGSMLARRIVRIRHGCYPVFRSPLRRTARPLHLLPLVAVQVFEEAVVPLHRIACPCAFQPAGDRIGTLASAEVVLPAETLL